MSVAGLFLAGRSYMLSDVGPFWSGHIWRVYYKSILVRSQMKGPVLVHFGKAAATGCLMLVQRPKLGNTQFTASYTWICHTFSGPNWIVFSSFCYLIIINRHDIAVFVLQTEIWITNNIQRHMLFPHIFFNAPLPQQLQLQSWNFEIMLPLTGTIKINCLFKQNILGIYLLV